MRKSNFRFNDFRIAAVVLSLLLVLLVLPATSQTITANIHGLVTDPSGAIVSGASVTAANVDTGVKVSAITNASGTYNIRFLQIGNYKVTVEAKGFTTNVFGPYKLEIGQDAKVDAVLKIGSEAESVMVSGDVAPILNTDNSQVDATFDENTIKSIPLNGQNFSSVMLYMPGAVSTEPTGMNGEGSVERNTGSNGQVSVNGNRLQTNNYTWDGVEINETINNLIGYAPSPEAIQEMKVVSATPNAEYGNANGGDVVMVMKSGTNQWHGSAYGFLENTNLNANTFSNKYVPAGTAPVARNAVNQTQFGGSVGGPILHNRLFFFTDYSGGRSHRSGPVRLSVATAKMRQGDFSELLDPAIMCPTAAPCSNLIQLYDPSNHFAPYAGNMNVPVVNPVAQYLFAHPELYPLPNTAPDPTTPTGENFTGNSKSFNRGDQGDIRVDYTLGQRDRIFGHYSGGEGSDGTPVYPVPVFFQSSSDYPDKIVVVGNTHTFSSSIVNELRAGYSRIRWIQGEPADTTGLFGLKGDQVVGIGNSGTQAFPGFAAQTISGLNTPGNPAGGTDFIDGTFDYSELLTWQHGKHSSKFGVEAVRYQQNNFYPGNDGALGTFQYNGNFTSNPTVAGAKGYSVADFVLDRVYFVGIGGVTGRSGQRQWRSAYFGQDDWRATPKLTLNLGLRYEFDQPIYEVNNKEANVDFTTGQAILAGQNGNSRALYNATYTNFMPRIGFAYQVTPKLVARGGYGITNYLEGTGANLRLTYNPPFQPSLELTGTAPTATSPGQFFRVEDGFTTSATPNYSGTTYRAWDKHLKPAFVNTYSFSTQYQVNNQSSLTISYIGESGAHLIQAVAANQLQQPCYINGVFSDPNSAACAIADPAPFQALVGQSGGVVATFSEGMYNYNALQVQYRQRAIRGLEYTVNYTYGRAMTNTDGFFGVPSINGPSPYAQNAYDNHSEYGPVGQDIRNNLNGTAVYDLPVGRGRTFGSNMNRGFDEVVGGWRVSMTAVAYSGFPATPYSDNNNGGTNNKAIRPNQYFHLPIHHRSIANWFGTDPSAVACTVPGGRINSLGVACAYGTGPDGTYGTARPNSLRGPGYQQYDFSLFKDFTVFREHKINFRVDAFNALNISSYGNPNSDVDSGTFGQITNTRSPARQLQLGAKYSF